MNFCGCLSRKESTGTVPADGFMKANNCSLRAMGSKEALALLREIAPNMERALRIVYLEVFGT